MALIDVSFLMLDIDFTDAITIVKRAYTINQYGETVLTESPIQAYAVVQSGVSETDATLDRTQDSADFANGITVYYKGILEAASTGDYADLVIWNNQRYQVKSVEEDFANYGAGFTKAFCSLEAPNV